MDVPAGVDTGSRLRIQGEGEPGLNGGPRGDLYIYMEVAPHPVFRREGANIYCEAPITITQAALGAAIRVPTLEGEAELRIPAGTQSGTNLRLRGHGLPDLRGYQHGDQIVRVVIETPSKISRRQRELLEELEALSNPKNYPQQAAFNEKTRQYS